MIYIVFFFILGTAIGSFINVLIDRLPNRISIMGRSHCDHCGHTLNWLDLIPIASFFLLKARCRHCHKKISWYYPSLEIVTGALFAAGFLLYDLRFSHLFIYFGIASCLVVIFFADLKYHIIPDSIQLTLFIFAVIYRIYTMPIQPTRLNTGDYMVPFSLLLYQFVSCLIAGLIVMLPILFLFMITRGQGMGFGDVKLSFTIGFLLGVKSGLLSLYFAFILGAVVGLFLITMKRKQLKSRIAFGPFLVLGIITMILWGEKILQIIKNIYGL